MPVLPNLRTWSKIDKSYRPLLYLLSPGKTTEEAVFEGQGTKKYVPQAFVDTPQILYSKWPTKAGGIKAPLGRFTTPPKIALIGGGLANCVAGLELAKAGADVTLLEVSDRVGGRLKSILSTDGINYQEMGAMRFPPSEDILYYYARQLGFDFIPKFPNPGTVDTLLSYKGKVTLWTTGGPVPDEFETVHNGWDAFVRHGITGGNQTTQEFLSPADLTTLLQKSHNNDPTALTNAISSWQKYLTNFGANTFLEGLQRIFGAAHEWDIPGGRQWSKDDFERFGSLGVGSGGFGAFYDVGFNAILRVVVNGLETDQQTFAKKNDKGHLQPTGIQNLAQAIVDLASDPSKQKTPLKVLSRTAGVICGSASDSVTVAHAGRHPGMFTYDYAIVGTTSKAAFSEVLAKPEVHNNIDPAVANALRTVHMCASSKLFIRTNKFWVTNPGTPRAILSDGPVNQLYTLDYGHPYKGLVLVLYAWEQDSIKLERKTGRRLYKYLFGQLRTALAHSPEWKNWIENLHLTPLELIANLNFKHWQLDPRFLGAFVIAGPSQDGLLQTLFYDHLKLLPSLSSNTSSSLISSTSATAPTSALTETHGSAWSPILLNGDSYGWSGGWTQGALETALNNVSVILKARGQINEEEVAPTSLLKPDTYKY